MEAREEEIAELDLDVARARRSRASSAPIGPACDASRHLGGALRKHVACQGQLRLLRASTSSARRAARRGLVVVAVAGSGRRRSRPAGRARGRPATMPVSPSSWSSITRSLGPRSRHRPHRTPGRGRRGGRARHRGGPRRGAGKSATAEQPVSAITPSAWRASRSMSTFAFPRLRALQKAGRGELDEVAEAVVVGREQRQVVGARTRPSAWRSSTR